MIKKTLFNALLATAVLWSVSASAKMAPPSPPVENPHPPATVEDKKRAAFADQVIEILLKKDLPASLKPSQTGQPPNDFTGKNLGCLQDAACYGKDAAFVNELLFFRDTYGKAVETKHTHVIPWSFDKFRGGAAAEAPPPSADMGMSELMRGPRIKADEYMMHVYIRFDKAGAWHHLDVIVNEDKAGNLFLRHFFVMPMQSEMPPGVVC
ncbi:MAG TPA: hypothetical protein VFX30_02850 [bacterium]|nr:hypothetical protein [bacterium]